MALPCSAPSDACSWASSASVCRASTASDSCFLIACLSSVPGTNALDAALAPDWLTPRRDAGDDSSRPCPPGRHECSPPRSFHSREGCSIDSGGSCAPEAYGAALARAELRSWLGLICDWPAVVSSRLGPCLVGGGIVDGVSSWPCLPPLAEDGLAVSG